MTTCGEEEKNMLAEAQAQVKILESLTFRDIPYDLIQLTEFGEQTVVEISDWYKKSKQLLETFLDDNKVALTKLKSANQRLRDLSKLVNEDSNAAFRNIYKVTNTLQNALYRLSEGRWLETPPEEII